MEIYIVLALSFAIMYWWKYTREIIKTVQGVEEKLNLVEATLSPSRYTTRMFLLTFLMPPWYLIQIATQTRWGYRKMKATSLIRQQCVVEVIV